MEKTGAVTLTYEELCELKRGNLPTRLQETWELTLEELQTIIRSGNYRLTGTNSDDNFKLNY